MGKDKNTESTSSKTEYTMSPEEREWYAGQNKVNNANIDNQIALNKNASGLANSLMQGQALPGYLNTLPGGISPEVTQGIVDQSLKDIAPGFQASGILDSGVAAQISARTAADIRNQSAQFNIQNLMQLLNLASGSSAQAQQPMQSTSAMLGSSLQGLRSVNQSGSTTKLGMNPFWKSFQNSAGTNLGANFNGPAWAGAIIPG